MKKKLISILLLLLIIFFLSSCGVKKHETENYSVKVGGGPSMSGLSYEVLTLLVRDCSERIDEVYLIYYPQKGSFTLDSGEEFSTEITDCSFSMGGFSAMYRISFTLSIYDKTGKLLCEGVVYSSWQNSSGAGYHVDEELLPYWLACSVPFSQIKTSLTESGGVES